MPSAGHAVERFVYRIFRATKRRFVRRKPDSLTRLFYWLLGIAERTMSPRKLTKLDVIDRRIWKTAYFARFGSTPPFSIRAGKPVALDSSDHKWPHGTLYDNSTNRAFNLKLYDFFGNRPDLAVLDLGCSGGAFVKMVLEDGFMAVGVEGSDVSRKLRSGEWDTCLYHLLTADIADEFQIVNSSGDPVRFHCITAWEVLEHIPSAKLPALLANIRRHLYPDGIFAASVAIFPDENPVTGAIYHVTLEPKSWWLDRFAEAGMRELNSHPFETKDYVRGHGVGLTNWSPNDGDGFHLVMKVAAP